MSNIYPWMRRSGMVGMDERCLCVKLEGRKQLKFNHLRSRKKLQNMVSEMNDKQRKESGTEFGCDLIARDEKIYHGMNQ